MTIDVISLVVLFVIVAAISVAIMAIFYFIGRRKKQLIDESSLPEGPSEEINIDDNFEKSFLSILLVAFLGIAIPFICIWAMIFKTAVVDGAGMLLAIIMIVFLCPLALAYLSMRREA